jgi:glycosyltransferase involved in cell wall biosynthesis
LHQPLQFLLLRCVLKKDVKIIAQHHAEKPFTGIKRLLQKIADKYIDAYLFASQTMGVDWIKHVTGHSTKKVHEVMEISSIFYPVERKIAIAHTNVKGGPVFLWVGRLNANKDPLNVIAGFLMFVHIVPSATLYMIYHTDELLSDILELIKDHSYKDSITLIGKMPNDELLYWYNSADFIISGSHYEGSGTAICEAMSCGCVPVVTDIPSFRMITDSGKCGILYDAGNTDALLNALIKTIDLDLEQKQLLCLSYFDSHLSFDAIAGRISAIAESL